MTDEDQARSHHAYLICDPEVSAEEIGEFEEALSGISSDLVTRVEPPEPQGAIEWALPALVLAILGKPFWDGFIGEMVGEAGAHLAKRIKAGAKSLFLRLRGRAKIWANPAQIEAALKRHEEGEEPEVKGARGPILRIKFLIREEPSSTIAASFVFLSSLTAEQFEDAMDKMFMVVRDGLQEEKHQATVDFLGIFSTTHVFDVTSQGWIRV